MESPRLCVKRGQTAEWSLHLELSPIPTQEAHIHSVDKIIGRRHHPLFQQRNEARGEELGRRRHIGTNRPGT